MKILKTKYKSATFKKKKT